jgi:hypothetical protein
MLPLTVLVMGRTGLIYSKNHEEANDKETVDISIPITKEMAPEADLVVFYLRDDDGTPVYDTNKLLIAHTFDNEVSFNMKLVFSNHQTIHSSQLRHQTMLYNLEH